MSKDRYALIALACLIVPGLAQAASGHPVSGDLSFGGDVLLRGPTQVTSQQGILSLVADHATPPRATITWTSADVVGYHNVWNYMDTPLPQPAERVRYHSDSWFENFSLGASRLDDFRCGEGCRLYVAAVANASGTVGAAGDANEALRWSAERRAYSAGSTDNAGHGWQSYAEAGWLRVGNVATVSDTLALSNATALASGDLWVVLSNGSARVTTLSNGHTRVLDSSSTEQPLLPARPPGGPMRRDHVFYAIHVRGASLATRPGTLFTLDASSAIYAVDGTLSALSASGTIENRGGSYTLADEPLLATGAIEFNARVARDATLLSSAPPQVQGHIASDSGTLSAAGIVLTGPEPLMTAARGAELGAAALLLALAGRPLHVAYFAGYSRIARADVLANENRRRIFETIRAAPGLTLTQTARRLQLARVVALHHVRMLAEHRFIVERLVGGRRFYYLAESAPPQGEATAATVLVDATRRRIAEAIQTAPTPPTQRQLVERTGVPQRLISYHLSKLVAGGLVQPEGRLPRRYRWQ